MHYDRHCKYSYTVSNKSVIRAASTSSFVALLFCYFGYFDIFPFILCCWVVFGEQRYTSRRYPSLHHYNWQWFSTFKDYHYLKYLIFKTMQNYALKWFFCSSYTIDKAIQICKYIQYKIIETFTWYDVGRMLNTNIFSQAIYFTSNHGVFTFISCPYTHDYA